MRNMGGYLIKNPWWLSRLVRNLREQLGVALNCIPFEGVEQRMQVNALKSARGAHI